MGEGNDPYFDEGSGQKPDFPGVEGPRRGCLFYGCIGVLVVGALVGALLAILSVVAYRFSSRMVERYTATAPDPVPVVKLPEPRIQSIEERVNAFEDAAEAGDAATLNLTAEELNALIARDPNLRGRVAVDIEGDLMQGQLSFPLEELGLPNIILGGLKGRYLNGMATFTPTLNPDGTIGVQIDDLTVKGQPVPDEFLKKLNEPGSAIRFDLDETGNKSRALRRLKEIEVRDGRLILKTRSADDDADAASRGEASRPDDRPEPATDSGPIEDTTDANLPANASEPMEPATPTDSPSP